MLRMLLAKAAMKQSRAKKIRRAMAIRKFAGIKGIGGSKGRLVKRALAARVLGLR